ncbi:hypothetical protein F8388_027310 [Cannabis sativa]|uniref:F-box domain-containing protein n=1 Tax=Cannabis sativa TaxID=3483 RepID=A0A7J6FPR3_CANSA|nr:hypothetical protein F8388_027310 [Cannabis sativa]
MTRRCTNLSNQQGSEIITDILVRLSVKDLLRYRCVSKPWCSLIDGPDFIKVTSTTPTPVWFSAGATSTGSTWIILTPPYDPINDDYKLIRGYLCYKEDGVLVGNALHWVVYKKPVSDVSNLIAAFDIVSEEYYVVPQPNFVDCDFHMTLNVLGSCLCLIANYTSERSSYFWETKADRIDIWVMKDYGVKESWTKLCSVVPSDEINFFCYVFPVTYLKHRGNQILMDQDSKKFILYDLESNKAKNVMCVCVCLQSLVGLGGRDGEISGKKAEKLRWKRKLKKEMKPKEEEAAKRELLRYKCSF